MTDKERKDRIRELEETIRVDTEMIKFLMEKSLAETNLAETNEVK